MAGPALTGNDSDRRFSYIRKHERFHSSESPAAALLKCFYFHLTANIDRRRIANGGMPTGPGVAWDQQCIYLWQVFYLLKFGPCLISIIFLFQSWLCCYTTANIIFFLPTLHPQVELFQFLFYLIAPANTARGPDYVNLLPFPQLKLSS